MNDEYICVYGSELTPTRKIVLKTNLAIKYMYITTRYCNTVNVKPL
jgi:hypothetical protein